MKARGRKAAAKPARRRTAPAAAALPSPPARGNGAARARPRRSARAADGDRAKCWKRSARSARRAEAGVFTAVLKNATRLCEAKFGALHLCDGDMFRTVALHNAPKNYAAAKKRDPMIHGVEKGNALDMVRRTKKPVQEADVLNEPRVHQHGSAIADQLRRNQRRPQPACRADAQGWRA